MSANTKYDEVDNLLNRLLHGSSMELRSLFKTRLDESNLSFSAALDLLQVEHRALNGVLDATQKRHDLLMLLRLAEFLQIPLNDLVENLVNHLKISFADEVNAVRKHQFILKNFDLAYLKKIGFIENTKDIQQIEERIITHFGYDDIFDYGREVIGAVWSSAKTSAVTNYKEITTSDEALVQNKPKVAVSFEKAFWATECARVFSDVNNYFPFDAQKLIEYVPYIRWHSMNVSKGLFQVIRDLFKLGVTVIIRPYQSRLYARAATFAIKGKPCVVLTDYSPHYPTLWFALLHELNHVLFDWEEILTSTKYHLTGELDLFSPQETLADEFAANMLIQPKMLEMVIPQIDNETFVAEFAKANQIHRSFIYIRYCWQMQEEGKNVWAKYNRFIPNITAATAALPANPWQSKADLKQIAKRTQETYFKGI